MPHIPVRTCVGCRRRASRSELVRLAVDDRGRVTLDVRAQRPGRGAYLCLTTGETCLAEARRRRALSRSLRVGEDAINVEELAAALGRIHQEVLPSPPSRS